MQISESHCGPATVQMLLGNLDVNISQEAIAEAGGATNLITMYGMRVDQMAEAVEVLAQGYEFWWKKQASLNDLITLVEVYGYPVGVEWQGLFEGEPEEGESETGNEDYGHYSVVTEVLRTDRRLVIADPYKDYFSQDRVFTFEEFEQRWWDTNEITDASTGKPRLVEDNHLLFIITPAGEEFPPDLGMRKGKPDYFSS